MHDPLLSCPCRLTLPYWELKLIGVPPIFSVVNLTLPYWELKLGADPKSIHMDNLTLPYWELKLGNLRRLGNHRRFGLTLPYWGFYHTKKQLQRWTEAAFFV